MPDSPATNQLVDVQATGAVARMTLCRARQRNALSTDLLAAMHAGLDTIELACAEGPDTSQRPRVLVITGADGTFCAGMDLKEVVIAESGDAGLGRRLLGELGRFTLRLRALPAVVVAGVAGPAIGGGCGLACACDIAVGYADGKLGFPEVDLGLCPAVIAPWVVRKMGPGRARRALLTGGVMTGRDAFELGILDHLAPDRDSFPGLLDRVVDNIARGGPDAIAATKNLLNSIDHSLEPSLIERGADLSANVLASDPAQAALQARLSPRA